jgi:Bacterial Ig-like domain (group 1)
MYAPILRLRVLAVALSSLAVVAACSSDSSTAPPTPASLNIVVGSDSQIAPVGDSVGTIKVTVLSSAGLPVPGATVNWAVTAGGGTVSSPTSVADEFGIATVTWTLGKTAGADSLSATVDGAASGVVISATAAPGPVASLVKVAGDAQTVVAGSTTQPLVVKAVDGFGNAVPGATIDWVPENGGELSASSSVTGSDGTATDVLTVDAASTYQVMAALQDNSALDVVFTETGD